MLKRLMMRDQIGDTYVLGFRAVQDRAPDASGIYAIFTPRRWLHIGETDDIRRSLLDHLNDPDVEGLAESDPLSFSFEVVPPDGRVARRRALIAQLAPGLAGDTPLSGPRPPPLPYRFARCRTVARTT